MSFITLPVAARLFNGMYMPRFKVGDRVKILPVSATPFVGLEGTIDEVLPNNRDITMNA